MTNEELVEKIGEFIQPLVNGVAHLKTEASHMKTAVEALKAGQDDLRENVKDLRENVVGLQAGQKAIREEMATKADIKRLEQKVETITKDHEERIEELELAHHKN